MTRPSNNTAGTALITGGVVLAVSCGAVRRAGTDTVGGTEHRWFRRMNRPLGPVEAPIRAVMQFGNAMTSVVAPAVLIATGTDRRVALRTGLAAGAAWQLAKAVKRLLPRERPARLLDEVALRDGDPTGRGFVSGHTTVATAAALTAGAGSSPPMRVALGAAALAVGFARVHVGAHLPLDVLGGAGLGLVVGAAGIWLLPTHPPGSQARNRG